MSGLGIVIPAYNASATLAAVVARIPAVIDRQLERIWIINDGSNDETAAVAKGLARQRAKITLIDRPRNGGYGAAVKTGLRAARAAGVRVAACVHADGQYAPEVLPRLLASLDQQGLDLLQGSRIASGTALSGGMPLYKFVANRTLTTMENAVFRLALSDYHSGFIIYGPRALREIPFERLSNSFDFDLEVIASARARRLRIGERAIPTHYGDEVSYLNPLTYGLRVLRVMAGYMLGRYHPPSLP